MDVHEPPTVQASPLLRLYLQRGRLLVTQFMGDEIDEGFRAEKAEAEAYVAAAETLLASAEGDQFAAGLASYLNNLVTYEIERTQADGTSTRLVAFMALQRWLDDAMDEFDEQALDAPRREDPVFAAHPELFDRLDRAGLLRITPEMVHDDVLHEGVVVHRDDALFAHRHLAWMRELVVALLELARRRELAVWIAIHPHRLSAVDRVPMRLIHDYCYGIKITADNLDSLDAHDAGVPSFHVARQGTFARRWFPLLGSWFDWDRRSKHDGEDPVKRLYVREVRPPVDRHGDALLAVDNRELHSERETARKAFTHVDGKIARYDASTYAPSFERPNAPPGHPARRRKLWRVDGPLADDEWAELVGLFFRGNELIAEHFEQLFPGVFAPGA
jgi:hypothetical protein